MAKTLSRVLAEARKSLYGSKGELPTGRYAEPGDFRNEMEEGARAYEEHDNAKLRGAGEAEVDRSRRRLARSHHEPADMHHRRFRWKLED